MRSVADTQRKTCVLLTLSRVSATLAFSESFLCIVHLAFCISLIMPPSTLFERYFER
jgi:hypothetical protein